MTALTLFGNNALANSDLFKSLQESNTNLLSGGGNENRRISIKGGKFRQILNGEQVAVSKDNEMSIIIVNAAPIGRTYYDGVYDPNTVSPPLCWSVDTKVPAPEVTEEGKQAARCMDCAMNIKGSGTGNSRACRFSQRIAITLEGKPEEVYQMQLPATSIFGEAEKGNMPMQAYARHLQAHNTPAISVVTEVYFDEDAETPKMFFKPVRPLTEDELELAVIDRDSEAAKSAITMTVSQKDNVSPVVPPVEKSEVAAKPKAKTKNVLPPEEDEDEEVQEPVKAKGKKPAAKAPEDSDLSSVLDDWDD